VHEYVADPTTKIHNEMSDTKAKRCIRRSSNEVMSANAAMVKKIIGKVADRTATDDSSARFGE
jgi:hypothetical protein